MQQTCSTTPSKEYFQSLLKNIINSNVKKIVNKKFTYDNLVDEVIKTLDRVIDPGEAFSGSARMIRYVATIPSSIIQLAKSKTSTQIIKKFYNDNESIISANFSPIFRLASYREVALDVIKRYQRMNSNGENLSDNNLMWIKDHAIKQHLDDDIDRMIDGDNRWSAYLKKKLAGLEADKSKIIYTKIKSDKRAERKLGVFRSFDAANNTVRILNDKGEDEIIPIKRLKGIAPGKILYMTDYKNAKRIVKNADLMMDTTREQFIVDEILDRLKIAREIGGLGKNKALLPPKYHRKEFGLLYNASWSQEEYDKLQDPEKRTLHTFMGFMDNVVWEDGNDEASISSFSSFFNIADNIEDFISKEIAHKAFVPGNISPKQVENAKKLIKTYEADPLFNKWMDAYNIFENYIGYTKQILDESDDNVELINIADEFDSMQIYEQARDEVFLPSSMEKKFLKIHNPGEIVSQEREVAINEEDKKEVSKRKHIFNAIRSINDLMVGGKKFKGKYFINTENRQSFVENNNYSFTSVSRMPVPLLKSIYKDFNKMYSTDKPIGFMVLCDDNGDFIKCDDFGNLIFANEGAKYDNAEHFVSLNMRTNSVFQSKIAGVSKRAYERELSAFVAKGGTIDEFNKKIYDRDIMLYEDLTTDPANKPDYITFDVTGGSNGTFLYETDFDRQIPVRDILPEGSLVGTYVTRAPWSYDVSNDSINKEDNQYNRTGFEIYVAGKNRPLTMAPINSLENGNIVKALAKLFGDIKDTIMTDVNGNKITSNHDKLSVIEESLKTFMLINNGNKQNKVYKGTQYEERYNQSYFILKKYSDDKGNKGYVLGLKMRTNDNYVSYFMPDGDSNWYNCVMDKAGDVVSISNQTATNYRVETSVTEFFNNKRGSEDKIGGNNSDYFYAKVNSDFERLKNGNSILPILNDDGTVSLKTIKYSELIRETSNIVLSIDNIEKDESDPNNVKISVVKRNPFLTFELNDARVQNEINSATEKTVNNFIDGIKKKMVYAGHTISDFITQMKTNLKEEEKKYNESIKNNPQVTPQEDYFGMSVENDLFNSTPDILSISGEEAPFSIGHTDEVNDEDLAKAKEWYDKSFISGLYRLEDLRDQLHEKGVARWTKDAITLFKGSDYTELYHEAWHGFTQGMMTKEERERVYGEMRKYDGTFKDHSDKIVSFKNASNEQLEEYLADNYRLFAKQKGRFTDKQTETRKNVFGKVWSFIRNFFKKIYNCLQKLTKNGDAKTVALTENDPLSNELIKDLYETLYTGKTTGRTFDIDRREFDVLYSRIHAVTDPVIISDSDTIVWAHSAIGKSTYIENNNPEIETKYSELKDNKQKEEWLLNGMKNSTGRFIIDWDELYNQERNTLLEKIATELQKDEKHKDLTIQEIISKLKSNTPTGEYAKFFENKAADFENLANLAKEVASKNNLKVPLFVASPTYLLQNKEIASKFDKIIDLDKNVYVGNQANKIGQNLSREDLSKIKDETDEKISETIKENKDKYVKSYVNFTDIMNRSKVENDTNETRKKILISDFSPRESAAALDIMHKFSSDFINEISSYTGNKDNFATIKGNESALDSLLKDDIELVEKAKKNLKRYASKLIDAVNKNRLNNKQQETSYFNFSEEEKKYVLDKLTEYSKEKKNNLKRDDQELSALDVLGKQTAISTKDIFEIVINKIGYESLNGPSQAEVLTRIANGDPKTISDLINYCKNRIDHQVYVLESQIRKIAKAKKSGANVSYDPIMIHHHALLKKMSINYGTFNNPNFEGVAKTFLLTTPIFSLDASADKLINEDAAMGENYGDLDNDQSIIDTMKKDIKFLLSTLVDEKSVNDYGYHKFFPFKSVCYTLQVALSKPVDEAYWENHTSNDLFDKMYYNLEKLAETWEPAKQILARLGKKDEHKSIDEALLFSRFFQTFSKARVESKFLNLKSEKDEKGNKVETSTVGNAVGEHVSIIRKWIDDFEVNESKYTKLADDGLRRKYDDDALGKLNSRDCFDSNWNFINIDISNIGRKVSDKIVQLGDSNQKILDRNGAIKLINWLKDLGINLTVSDALIDDFVRNFYQPIYGNVSFKDAIENLKFSVSPKYKTVITSFNQLVHEQMNSIIPFALLESKYNNERNPFQFRRADGNVGYENMLHNEYSIIADGLNSCYTYEQVLNTPHLAWMDIRQYVTDENGNRVINKNYNQSDGLKDIITRMFGPLLDNPKDMTRKRVNGENKNPYVKVELSQISGTIINQETQDGVSRYGEDTATHLAESILLAQEGFVEITRPADKPTCFCFKVNDGASNKAEISIDDINKNVVINKSIAITGSININYSKGENSILSNFSTKPFKHKWRNNTITEFTSVEQAFQYAKAIYFNDIESANKILKFGKNSYDAKDFGGKVKGYDDNKWNSVKDSFMKTFMKEAFKNNISAKKALFDTIDKKITHDIGGKVWGERFVENLISVRNELMREEGLLNYNKDSVSIELNSITSNKIIDIVRNKAISECERIVKLNLIENDFKHHYISSNYLNYGKKFTALDGILTKETQDSILKDLYGALGLIVKNQKIDLLDKSDDKTDLYKKITEIINDHISDIKSDALNYYKELVSKSIENVVAVLYGDGKGYGDKNEKFDLSGILKANNKNLPEVIMIANWAINSSLHNLKYWDVINGDLAQFSVADANKRNAGGNGTGEIFRTDKAITDFINRTLAPTSYWAIESRKDHKDDLFSRIVGKVSSPETNPFQYGSILNTATLQEIETLSSYKEIYKDILGEKASKDYFKPMKECDGQGFISFDAYRALKIAQGSWSSIHEELFEKVCRGENISIEDATKFFPVYKTQYYGPSANEELIHETAMHKYSLCPIIPSVVKGTILEALHYRMMKEGIAYAAFDSCKKVSKAQRLVKKGDKIVGKEDSIFDLNEPGNVHLLNPDIFRQDNEDFFVKDKVYTQYLKDQVLVHDTDEGKILFPTQLRRVIEIEAFNNGVPVDYKGFRGTWENLSESAKRESSVVYNLIRQYEEDVKLYMDQEREELFKKLDIKFEKGSYRIGNVSELKNIITRELSKDGVLDVDIQRIYDKIESGKDISFLKSSDNVEDIITSLINRRLVKQQVKGDAFVQVASSLFQKLKEVNEKKEDGTRWTNPTDADLKKYGTRDLPFYLPSYKKGKDGEIEFTGNTKAMKVKVALRDNFKELLNEKMLNGDPIKVLNDDKSINMEKSLANLNKCIKQERWLNQGDRRQAVTLTGVRIPTQGPNSIECMEVYEFLPPEAGNIIIPPAEIVIKAGSDFDIDKMYIMMNNIITTSTGIRVPSRNNILNNDQKAVVEDIEERITELKEELREVEESISNLKETNKNTFQINKEEKEKLFKDILESAENIVKNKKLYEIVKDYVKGDKLIEKADEATKKFLDKNKITTKKIESLIEIYNKSNKSIKKELDEKNKLSKEISNIEKGIKKLEEEYLFSKSEKEKEKIYKKINDIKIDTLDKTKKKLSKAETAFKAACEDSHKNNKELFSLIYKIEKSKAIEEVINSDDYKEKKAEIDELYKELNDSKIERLELIQKAIELKDELKFLNASKKSSAISNDLIQDIKAIMMHPSFFKALVTPNSTDYFRKPQTEGGESFEEKFRGNNEGVQLDLDKGKGASISNPLHDESKYNSNYIGKKNLGILAVENVSFSSILREGLRMKISKDLVNDFGVIGFNTRQYQEKPDKFLIDFSGKYLNGNEIAIQDCISQLINGAVDVAKDDWLFFLGLKKELISTFTFMIMGGVDPYKALSFINKKEIMNAIKAVARQNSKLIEFGKTENEIREIKRIKIFDEEKLKLSSKEEDKNLLLYANISKMASSLTKLKLLAKVDTDQSKSIGVIREKLKAEDDAIKGEEGFGYFFEEEVYSLLRNSVLTPFNTRRLKYDIISNLEKTKADLSSTLADYPFELTRYGFGYPKFSSQTGQDIDAKKENYYRKLVDTAKSMLAVTGYFMKQEDIAKGIIDVSTDYDREYIDSLEHSLPTDNHLSKFDSCYIDYEFSINYKTDVLDSANNTAIESTENKTVRIKNFIPNITKLIRENIKDERLASQAYTILQSKLITLSSQFDQAKNTLLFSTLREEVIKEQSGKFYGATDESNIDDIIDKLTFDKWLFTTAIHESKIPALNNFGKHSVVLAWKKIIDKIKSDSKNYSDFLKNPVIQAIKPTYKNGKYVFAVSNLNTYSAQDLYDSFEQLCDENKLIELFGQLSLVVENGKINYRTIKPKWLTKDLINEISRYANILKDYLYLQNPNGSYLSGTSFSPIISDKFILENVEHARLNSGMMSDEKILGFVMKAKDIIDSNGSNFNINPDSILPTYDSKKTSGFYVVSGGAIGADHFFGLLSKDAGFKQYHFVIGNPSEDLSKETSNAPFATHQVSSEDVETCYQELNGSEEYAGVYDYMYVGDKPKVKDAKALRDMQQARESDVIIAIASFSEPTLVDGKPVPDQKTHRGPARVIVSGGTGYACAYRMMEIENASSKELYVYNQEATTSYPIGWYKYELEEFENKETNKKEFKYIFKPINYVPNIHSMKESHNREIDKYGVALIGDTKLSRNGKLAALSVFGKPDTDLYKFENRVNESITSKLDQVELHKLIQEIGYRKTLSPNVIVKPYVNTKTGEEVGLQKALQLEETTGKKIVDTGKDDNYVIAYRCNHPNSIGNPFKASIFGKIKAALLFKEWMTYGGIDFGTGERVNIEDLEHLRNYVRGNGYPVIVNGKTTQAVKISGVEVTIDQINDPKNVGSFRLMNKEQLQKNYELISNLRKFKEKTRIYYYGDFGYPTHATVLDALINDELKFGSDYNSVIRDMPSRKTKDSNEELIIRKDSEHSLASNEPVTVNQQEFYNFNVAYYYYLTKEYSNFTTYRDLLNWFQNSIINIENDTDLGTKTNFIKEVLENYGFMPSKYTKYAGITLFPSDEKTSYENTFRYKALKKCFMAYLNSNIDMLKEHDSVKFTDDMLLDDLSNKILKRYASKWIREFKLDNINQFLTDEVRDEEEQTVKKLVKDGIPYQKAISTIKPFFTDDEMGHIKDGLKGLPLHVVSFSRNTDPAFHSKQIIEFLEENSKKSFDDPTRVHMVEVWSKHDGKPIQNILRACKKYRVAPMLQFSISSLGNTDFESGVMPYNDLITNITKLIEREAPNLGYTAEEFASLITIRVDPIIPGVTKPDEIKDLVSRCSKLGIKKFVTSIMQSYGYKDVIDKNGEHSEPVIGNCIKLGYDLDKYYGKITEDDFNKSSEFAKKYKEALAQNKARVEHLTIDEARRKIKEQGISSAELKMAAIKEGIRYIPWSHKNPLTGEFSHEQAQKDLLGKYHHVPNKQYVDEITDMWKQIRTDNAGISIETCSFYMNGFAYSACLDPLVMTKMSGISQLTSKKNSKIIQELAQARSEKMGTLFSENKNAYGFKSVDDNSGYLVDETRDECNCFGCHSEIPNFRGLACYSNCVYCYAGKTKLSDEERKKMLEETKILLPEPENGVNSQVPNQVVITDSKNPVNNPNDTNTKCKSGTQLNLFD